MNVLIEDYVEKVIVGGIWFKMMCCCFVDKRSLNVDFDDGKKVVEKLMNSLIIESRDFEFQGWGDRWIAKKDCYLFENIDWMKKIFY